MPAGATYEPIATASPSGTAPVTFSSIPSTYTDLKLVCFLAGSASDPIGLQFNNDTGTNYSRTFIAGDGSTATSNRSSSATNIRMPYPYNATPNFSIAIFDIFSYAGSTNKTILATTGNDRNGSGNVMRLVGLWRSTAAINRIDVIVNGGDTFAAGSTFTLYGIKNSA